MPWISKKTKQRIVGTHRRNACKYHVISKYFWKGQHFSIINENQVDPRHFLQLLLPINVHWERFKPWKRCKWTKGVNWKSTPKMKKIHKIPLFRPLEAKEPNQALHPSKQYLNQHRTTIKTSKKSVEVKKSTKIQSCPVEFSSGDPRLFPHILIHYP